MNDLTHEEVFGHLRETPLTLQEAAEYLEIEESSLYYAYVDERIDAELMFSVEDLKRFKKEQELHK